MPEKTEKCFGRVKEKKPALPRKRKCLVCRTLRLKSYYGMLRISNKISICKSDVLGRTTSNQVADLAGENAEVLRESEGEEASAATEEEVFGLQREKILLLTSSSDDFKSVKIFESQ
ncbi:uncharacterized protein G2W53_014767 [Senna tora]|uniref:Uncharacterized protein n=1 Tax=Senna tora TaxID=362788 RepID=A0A834WU08_9FABA|nr:uncharacterized protein G2W53_014767 [Senna tora]